MVRIKLDAHQTDDVGSNSDKMLACCQTFDAEIPRYFQLNYSRATRDLHPLYPRGWCPCALQLHHLLVSINEDN